MTIQETRNMAIEFERRIQIMYPNSEFADKIDTDTIYSILSEYQLKYVNLVYMLGLKMSESEKVTARYSEIISPFIKQASIPYNKDGYKYPRDFSTYISSFSLVESTYKGRSVNTVENVLIPIEDKNNVIKTAFNKSIMRTPAVILNKDEIEVISDQYTNIRSITITYLSVPQPFNVSKDFMKHECDLPYSCFNDMVDGAIQLYMYTYKLGIQNAKNQPKENKEDKS